MKNLSKKEFENYMDDLKTRSLPDRVALLAEIEAMKCCGNCGKFTVLDDSEWVCRITSLEQDPASVCTSWVSDEMTEEERSIDG